MNGDRIGIGMLFCFIAVLTWGGLYPILDIALKIMDPFYLTLFRFFIAALILIILLLFLEGRKSFSTDGQGRQLWLIGTLGFSGFSFLVFLGQHLAGESGAIIAAVVMATQPILGVIMSWIIHRTPPKLWTILFMVTSLTGVLLVITKGDFSMLISSETNILAYLLILGGALSFVTYTTLSTQFSHWSILRFTTMTTLYSCVTNIVVVSIATLFGWLQIPTWTNISSATPSLIYMALIAGVFAYFLWNKGSRIITSVNAMLFMNLVPVTTFVISIIQGYQISLFEFIGAIVTIASLIANNLYIRKLQQHTLQGSHMNVKSS